MSWRERWEQYQRNSLNNGPYVVIAELSEMDRPAPHEGRVGAEGESLPYCHRWVQACDSLEEAMERVKGAQKGWPRAQIRVVHVVAKFPPVQTSEDGADV